MSRRLDLFGLGEVAEYLGISRDLVDQWLHRGKLPAPDCRLAGGPIWRASTIRRWQAARARELVSG